MLGTRKALYVGGVAAVAALAAAGVLLAQTPAAGTRAPATDAGRQQVEAVCTSCHAIGMIAQSSGYTRSQWDALITTMIDLPAEDKARALDYLAQAYPPNDRRAARIVEGPLRISFREWAAPTPGQRPRDPAQAPDGMVWWVGQRGNIIGRLDPATGAMQEWSLPPGALPHSVNIDAAGGVWYMGNGNGTIGKFDPATGRPTEYRMPDPAARDPHTAEFDRRGILWFTLQRSNMIGRFDPRTGETRLARISSPRVRPYGLKIDANGAPWVACNGGNCLIRVDPATMALTEIRLPGERTTVRRLDISSDGLIWYVNSSLGRLGRYNPATGDIKEWPSPSGPDSHPYAIAVINDVVWYNESGVRPDALVRFDPQTEKFQSWPIPSAGVYAGIVRHMRGTRNGELLLHQGSTNRIILATLPAVR